MLLRLAKTIPGKVSTSTWETSQCLLKHVGQQVSIFWNKPRVDAYAPGDNATNSRIRAPFDDTKSDFKRERRYHSGTGTPGGFLCTAVIGGGFLWAVDTFGKYRSLERARQEREAKYEQESMFKVQSLTSGAQSI